MDAPLQFQNEQFRVLAEGVVKNAELALALLKSDMGTKPAARLKVILKMNAQLNAICNTYVALTGRDLDMYQFLEEMTNNN